MSGVSGTRGLVPRDSRTTGGALHSLQGGVSIDAVQCRSPIAPLGSAATVSSSQSAVGAVLSRLLWVTAFRHNNILAGRNAHERQ